MRCTVYRKRADLAGDWEVSYLESTGTQWIDTGVVPGTTTEVEMHFSTGTYKNSTAYFGQNWAGSRFMLDMQSNNIMWHGSGNTIRSHVADEDALLTITSDNKLNLTVAGQTTSVSISRSATTSSLALFGCNTGTYLASFKLYSMKIWKDGSLVRDFVPVVIGGAALLFDKVSETYFSNKGSGQFNHGARVRPLSQDHMTYYTCRNRKAALSPVESGSKFLATRRCSLQPITLYFDPNGGSAEYTERVANVARRIKEFPATTYDDKHLFGWYDSSGSLVSDQDVASVRTQHLKASWVDPTTIELDPNGGSCDHPSVKLYRNVAAYNLRGLNATPADPSMNFVGWFTAASGGSQVKDTTTYNGSYTKLYAHYVSDTWTTQFTVTIDSEHNKAGIYQANRKSSAKPVYVDWGDGLTDTFNGNVSQQVHEYLNPGTYVVRISDNISTFALTANSAVWYQVTSQNYYTVKSIDMMSAGITSVPTYAFCYLNELTTACWTTGVASIPNYAFYYCGESFKKIVIPEGVITIGQYTFAQCKGLNDVTLPSTLRTLNTCSFQYCFYNEEGSIDIPEGVTAIPNYCFDQCLNLVDVKLPSTLLTIGQYSFKQCWYNAKGQELIIPEGVTTIDNYAFCQCRYLSVSPVLPSTLARIGQYAFYQCQYELKSIVIPQSCDSVENYSLAYCTNLADITIRRATAPTVGAQTFGNNATTYTGYATRTAGTNKLHVPVGSTGYTANPWSNPLCHASYCGFTLVEDAVAFASMPFQYVEFNPNGGTGGGMVKCYFGMDIGEVDVQVEPPEGKVLDGWWTMREGGMRVDDGTAYDGTWQIAYAHWREN